MKLNKNSRILLIVVISIIILTLVYSFISELTVVKLKEDKTVPFSFNSRATVDYTVFLRPNPLYNNTGLNKDEYIITEFIDYISTNYTFQYTSDKQADISGDYEIKAIIQGYTGQDTEVQEIWVKEFILVPNTKFMKNHSRSYEFNNDVKLELTEYNEFVAEVQELMKFSVNTRLLVVMNINITAETEYGSITENLAPNIVIPLGTNFFKVTGTLIDEKPGMIEKTIQVTVPVNYNIVYILIVVSVFLLFTLVYLIVFTKPIEPNYQEKMLNRVFNKHGDRLVAIKSNIEENFQKKYEVNTIEDLVRVSDEVEKPIIYQFSVEKQMINSFYVIHDEEMYIWRIKEIIKPDKSEYEYSEGTKKLVESVMESK